MKATLTFNLPEETDAFKDAQRGTRYVIALGEIGEYLRKRLKYEELTEAQTKILEEVRAQFYEEVKGLLE